LALEKIGLPDACFSGGGGAGTEGADMGKGDVVGAACGRAWLRASTFGLELRLLVGLAALHFRAEPPRGLPALGVLDDDADSERAP
jgi:hypothetical protein